MPKAAPQPDVLVLGGHPAAYLALLALSSAGKIRVLHAAIPGEALIDRFLIVNPEFFSLHPSLSPLREQVTQTPLFGLRFLSAQGSLGSEYRAPAPTAFVARSEEIRLHLQQVARQTGVELLQPQSLEIESVDEQGVHVLLDGKAVYPKSLIVAGTLSRASRERLSIPDAWEREVLHRYSFITLPRTVTEDRPLAPMCLDLDDQLCWGWALPHGAQWQLAVEQPISTIAKTPPSHLMAQWIKALQTHSLLPSSVSAVSAPLQSMDLPFAGALAQEGVANRTLLIGPAGGFFSDAGEDLYPNAWSALFAADVLRKALREKHLQDAISAYRQVWRTTLGDYLRGPQQNMRFLLPLIYRNPVMTQRLAESILEGKSVIREE